MYVEKINSPADLKKLSIDQLEVLSGEIRDIILQKVSKYGGHVGPDLGMVEGIIALHYVFDSPVDKIVFDVSHQTFAHKILTGRRDAFINNDGGETLFSIGWKFIFNRMEICFQRVETRVSMGWK